MSLTGRGRAKYSAKRHQCKVLKDNIKCIAHGDIRRVARRGGVKRINRYIYDDVRAALEAHLHEVLRAIVVVMGHEVHRIGLLNPKPRKIVTTVDVVYALKLLGSPVYGFGTIPIERSRFI